MKIIGVASIQKKLIEQHGRYDSIKEWEAEEPTQPDIPATMNALVFGSPKSPTHPSKRSVEELVRAYVLDEVLCTYLRDVE